MESVEREQTKCVFLPEGTISSTEGANWRVAGRTRFRSGKEAGRKQAPPNFKQDRGASHSAQRVGPNVEGVRRQKTNDRAKYGANNNLFK